jgi:hypothetical protein
MTAHPEIPEHTYFSAGTLIPKGSRLTVFHAPDNEGEEYALWYSDRHSQEPQIHICRYPEGPACGHGPRTWVAVDPETTKPYAFGATMFEALQWGLRVRDGIAARAEEAA